VIYVAHTLWAEEAETWLPQLPGLIPLARHAGRRLDLALSRAADAVLVLSAAAQAALAPAARGPLELIPPGYRPEAAPSAGEIAAACQRRGLAPDGFALYAGNLDRYQDLALLDAAAARAPQLPVVVATHDTGPAHFERLRVIVVDGVEEARRLLHGAALAVLPRRRAGGFAIKLLHYMAAGRAIVASASVAGSLVHDESAWLLPAAATADDFAAALRGLTADPSLRARLGAGARRALEAQHAWPPLAERTLALVRAAIEPARSRRSG
jgi:glycosyltransferase involved in cell wall biosynthesis